MAKNNVKVNKLSGRFWPKLSGRFWPKLSHKALLRTIAFSTTQCISTWRCLTLFSLQAVIVPVGRIALGRILNVVGSIIDPHSFTLMKHLFLLFSSFISAGFKYYISYRFTIIPSKEYFTQVHSVNTNE